jgi:outer membrane lipopolysaccharide assembly protein LptE/RlpB
MLRFALVLVMLFSAGCGFQLQGRADLPPVLAAAHIDFYLGLRSAMRSAGSSLQESPTTAGATIHLLSDGTSERVLTVSARNLPTAYELIYTVRISVDAGGRELLSAESFSTTREYSFDAAALLAKERERENLTTALADELVTVVMRRLSSLPAAE